MTKKTFPGLDALIGEKFSALSERDQRAAIMLAVFLLVVGAWSAVWLPIERNKAYYRTVYQNTSADLAWMQSHAEQAKSALSTQPKAGGVKAPSTLTEITDAATQHHIVIHHVEPTSKGGLKISFDTVAFNRLLPWLVALQREHAIHTTQAILERVTSNEPGVISARLVLIPN